MDLFVTTQSLENSRDVLFEVNPQSITKVEKQIPYFAVYNALPYILCSHVFGPNFQEKNLFYFLIHFLIYLYSETKLIIVF